MTAGDLPAPRPSPAPGRGYREVTSPVTREWQPAQPAPAGAGSAAGDRFRVVDAVDELCQQLAGLCASAVDSLEIAATLEAEGVTGQVARARYHFPDVFSLAEEIHRRTILRPAEPEPGPDPWQVTPTAHLSHGVLYAMPAACYAVAAPLLAGTDALVVVVVAVLVSWTLGQGLAYLGYARLGRADPGGAARLLRCALPASVLILLVTLTATALLVPVAMPVLLFAVAQGCYLLGATVLLVMRAQRWLWCALAPGVLLSAVYLLAGRPVTTDEPAWLPLAMCALLAGVLAVVQTARGGPTAGPIVVGGELRAAAPHALFGLLAAGLLVFPVVGGSAGHGVVAPAAALLSLPLSLSMGAAEWSLYWYRRRVRALLQDIRAVSEFAGPARLVLLGAVTRYAGAVVLLVAATLAVAAAGRMSLEWTVLRAAAAYLALGCALFLALLLQAVRAGLFTLVGCTAALGLEMVLVTGPPLGWDAVSAQLLASSVLFGGLLVRCGTVLGQVVAHT